MTAEKLIELLKKYPPQMEIWIARDEEGNGFEPLSDPGMYWMDADGESVMDQTDAERYADEGGEELRQVVVLWP